MDPAVSGSQGDKRVKFQPKIGLADQPCHAINDVVGLDPNVIHWVTQQLSDLPHARH